MKFLDKKYEAEIFGKTWAQGPKALFSTITAARKWAEEFGTEADCCLILVKNGKFVAEHRRDPSGDGRRWFRAA